MVIFNLGDDVFNNKLKKRLDHLEDMVLGEVYHICDFTKSKYRHTHRGLLHLNAEQNREIKMLNYELNKMKALLNEVIATVYKENK